MKNLVKELYRDCLTQLKVPINEHFLEYYCDLVSLNPDWHIIHSSDRVYVIQFKNYIINKLSDPKQPDIITLRIQFYFNCYWKNKDLSVEKNRQDLINKLKPLQNEILGMKFLEDDGLTYNTMYRKITYYCCLLSGLGNPTVTIVYKETMAALKSILNNNELREFIEGPRELEEGEDMETIKDQMLQEIVKIVTGIRLFNKDCNKGGEFIEDLPQLITKALLTSKADMQEILHWVMNTVNVITSALDLAYVITKDEENKTVISCIVPEGIDITDVNFIKDSLVVFRQYEIYLRKLIQEVEDLELFIVEKVFEDLKVTFYALHDATRDKLIIPVDQVFPYFIQLADTWTLLQDKVIYLSKLNKAVNDLNGFVKGLNFDEKVAFKILGKTKPISDTERMEATLGQSITQKGPTAQILKYENFKDKDDIKLQYLGFCAWKFVVTGGALLPGNPEIGIVKALNMHYACSCQEAGNEFALFPERYIMEAMKLMRRKPELINLLHTYKHLDLIKNINKLVTIPPKPKILLDESCQTMDSHVPCCRWDKDYIWNAWDWKRQAIRLANITKRQTHSPQTSKTYGKWSVSVNTCDPKNQAIQTKTDNYCNVPKPKNYIFGLRGRRDNKQMIVELTRPIEE